MTREWAGHRSLDRIRLLAGSGLDHHALRAAVLAEVGRVVPFDAFVWPLCDPRTTVGMAPRARIPCPQELPRLIRLKYLSGPARWTALMSSSTPAATLLQSTQGEPSRSPVWSGVLQWSGVRDVLSAVFADKYGCWAWLDLWRTDESGPFTVRETDYLGRVAEATAPGLRRAIALQFRAAQPPDAPHRSDDGPPRTTGLRHEPDPPGKLDLRREPDPPGKPGLRNLPDLAKLPEQAVLTLDEDLAVAGQTASVGDWLHLLQPGPAPHHHIPAEVLNVAGQLMAREAGVDTHEAECRVHIGAGHWASLRASRMDPGMPGSTPPLAVTIQACSAADRLDLFVRAFGLTPRQGELLLLAAAGADTAAMADAQRVTAYTVQDQFKQVFQACGVHSRAALLGLALGTGFRT